MKKLYLKDVARELNVSKTAVSLVLNGKGDENKISYDTQQKIINFAKKHNYIPNQLARGLSRGKSETIGLIIPNISDTFYSKVAGVIERKAKEKGYTVLFSSSYEDPKTEGELILSMLNRQVDGLIIASTQQNKKEIEFLKKEKFPFVLFDRYYPENETDYVIVDNFYGTKKVTEHLLNLGRKKVGFITLKPGLEPIAQRLMGYKEALKAHNLTSKETYVKEIGREEYFSEVEKAIIDLTAREQAVDAIVFSTHYLASQGLRVLKKLNLKVPDDVAIVSFDELSAFDIVEPPVTSVVQPVNEIGYSVIEILLNKIGSTVKTEFQTRVLKTKLEIRSSCGSFLST
ncbi:LacI family DNA-binding transcriptional regulator [Seonamhaeicola aphaedonensis]|uniref:LacI family transcriptional regulator n=1 Tax=Seonamhaeicola aphaedonensis TaxID=1461338 RepID=A0A3D9HDA5_9FLAO|nr:LacI family DNA-binding transcriptional regulator [Seonamhaeicola aphaedonensis]RED47462.1 LacI family transcriptional regulator [Seonamhaeicola aphaedonensis]